MKNAGVKAFLKKRRVNKNPLICILLEKKVKLTESLKKEIDGFTFGKLYSLFRFHPCDYTTGEAGKYTAKKIREKLDEEKLKGNMKKYDSPAFR